jgi:hypothetical protein
MRWTRFRSSLRTQFKVSARPELVRRFRRRIGLCIESWVLSLGSWVFVLWLLLTAHGHGITLGFCVLLGLMGSLAGAGSFFADLGFVSCSLSSLVALLTFLFGLETVALTFAAFGR